MKKLTARERAVLAALVLLALICGYVFLFHLPMEGRLAHLDVRIQESQDLLAQTRSTVERQQQMERELEALRAADPAPVAMPDYNNIQAVMAALEDVPGDAQTYSLHFTTEQAEDRVLTRVAELSVTCGSYDSARAVLQRLRDCPLRCQLEDISLVQEADGAVRMEATMAFFEYAAP